MTAVWAQAGVWLALALLASVISVWLRLATALSEIAVGMVAQLLIGAALGASALSRDASWVTFLSGTGAIVLTFLAGAELDPASFRSNWRQAAGIGLVSFAAPFLGCAALAIWVLGWSPRAGWLAGISMSTTSVAVVYAVMLEFGLNKTSYGKTVLAACFVTDLATVLALGLMFSPFTWRTGVFAAVAALVVVVLPRVVRAVFARFGGRPSEIEAKFLLAVLFGLAALATWAGSESVLPAYLVGMVLAGVVGRDHELVRRLRTLTFRASDAVLLPAGRLARVSPGSRGGADRLPCSPRCEGLAQGRRGLPGDAGIPFPPPRGRIHHSADVHWPHLRNHRRPLRSEPSDRVHGAILHPRCGGGG